MSTNSKVVYVGPDGGFRDAIERLKKGEIDSVFRSVNSNEQVYWRDSSGIIQWKRPEEKDDTNGIGRTLLVLMPAWNNDYPPFGLAHIAAALKSSQFPVDVLDLNWVFWSRSKEKFENPQSFMDTLLWAKRERYEKSVKPFLEEIFSTLEEKIRTGTYSYVGFSLFDSNWQPSFDAFELIRKINPKIKIFCGGPSCTDAEPISIGRCLENNLLDAAVFGEGEVSLIELIKKWTEARLGGVPGTWVRDFDGSVQRAPARPLTDINTLPFPDFSPFPIYNYDLWMLPIYMSRGCVAQCTFCAETKYWVRFRILKTERLLSIIEKTILDHGIRDFSFNDSLMNGSPTHLEGFVDAVIEKKINLSFRGYCRLESKLNKNVLNKMSKAGCQKISFGMESASQKVTELMKKGVDVKNYERIVKDTAAAGIDVTCCLIVGFPGEGWIDFFRTAWTLVKLRSAINSLNIHILAPREIGKSAQELARLGIENGGLAADEWKTIDGKNTPIIRLIRFWILVFLWRHMRTKDISQGSWYFKKGKLPSIKEFIRLARRSGYFPAVLFRR